MSLCHCTNFLDIDSHKSWSLGIRGSYTESIRKMYEVIPKLHGSSHYTGHLFITIDNGKYYDHAMANEIVDSLSQRQRIMLITKYVQGYRMI
jgi:hypothetical protein